MQNYNDINILKKNADRMFFYGSDDVFVDHELIKYFMTLMIY